MTRAKTRNQQANRQPSGSRSDQRNISVEWLHGIPPEKQDEFTKSWRNSTFVLDQLKGIVERELENLYIDLKIDYEVPNWQYIRADKNGRIVSLERVLKLLP